jgi:hypothetical protein
MEDDRREALIAAVRDEKQDCDAAEVQVLIIESRA